MNAGTYLTDEANSFQVGVVCPDAPQRCRLVEERPSWIGWSKLHAGERLVARADLVGKVWLEGGPMDGWLVESDAPSLSPDWWRTWPPTIVERWQPGRYVLDPSGRSALWVQG